MLKQIMRESPTCCSAEHDVDVQQPDSQIGAMMNQNCTRNRGDSQTSVNTKLILSVLGRTASFPIMFILPFFS